MLGFPLRLVPLNGRRILHRTNIQSHPMPESTTPSTQSPASDAPTNARAASGKSKSSTASNGTNGQGANGHLHESNGTVVTDPDEIGAPELEATELARVKQSSLPGSGSTGWTPGFRSQTAPDRALKFARHFTQAGQDPFSTSQWERRTASITGENGKSVFEQKDCEIPAAWSQLATNVVVSKYFRGPMNTPQRETSVRQVIGRVADTIGDWGKQGGYFASDEDGQAFRDELVYLLLHQYGAFNSPVWFNLGVKGARQQASACFINSVYDDMESIMELAATEARLFKGGSGAGTNLFRIRSSREQLSGGGIASGPVSFMRGWDAFAGAIKSGGTCLAPYQRVYTESGPVAVEELAQREGFITLSFDPPANRYKAKRARAWLAGRKRVVRVETDKGQFDLSFDHPVKLSSGEYVRAGDLKEGQSLFACSIDSQHGHVRVHLRDGQKGKEFLHRLVAGDVLGHDLEGLVVHHRDGDKGNNAPDNLEVMTQAQHAALHGRETALRGEHIFQTGDFSHAGSDNGMHRDGTFWTSEAADSYRELQSDILVRSGRAIEMQREAARQKTLNTAFRVLNAGWPIETFEQYARGRKAVIGRIASLAQLREQLDEEFGSYDEFRREVARSNHRVLGVSDVGEMNVYDVEVECPTPDDKSPQTGHNFLIWHGEERTGSGVIVANTRRAAKMVILNADHPDIADFIVCKANEEKKAWALIDAGYNGGFNVPGGAYDSVAFQNANHSVRVTDEFMRAAENGASWSTRAVTSGAVVETLNARDLLHSIAETTHICGDPGLQYDTTLNDWHTCPNSGRINASNPCCVTGDTLVAVADGRVAVPIRELVETEVPVFAHDHATGKTTISRMWNISVKRENVPVFRVTLDDGTTFRATDDHLIMLRDGSYRMARDLSAGDSLMPFHSKVLAPQKNRTKRRYIWNGASWTPQYRALWNFWNGEQPVGTHIHHAGFDALNDAPDNLVLLDASEHNALHVSKMVGDNNPARRLMNDEWRGNIACAVSGERNPHFGKTHSDAAKAQMSDKAKARFESREERDLAAQRALNWMEEARAQGRKIGRTPKEREVRCCPVCRENFGAARETQVFCSNECRQSPMGRAMIGAKGGAAKTGRTVSLETRAKLSVSVSRASNPAQKAQAGRASNRASALKAARLLLDNGVEPAFASWDALRLQARALGAKRVPRAATLSHLFACESEFQEAATLYNHKVVSVEACGFEDVYDGTVDTHHNFAILTSVEDSCANGHQNFSGIFIHNSEFVFLDDTACNLASINLLKFYDFDTGHFDARSYVHTSETFLTAQEIIVSFASYPTAKIAENSELFRPLGLGYCNVGALLMAMGLAYDSDEGRAFAGALTAIMTGAAYRQSAKIARNTGAFEGYALNREPMLRVIGKHRDAVGRINSSLVAPNVMEEARSCWDEALLLGQKHGYRNSQVTVLAPTGTISFMMDADTTGVEPDIALVKYKKLVGGGLLKIVNQTVPAALRKLGYDENEIQSIVEYIDKNDTIEGAPGLEDRHLSVFDCAFKAMNGVRSIHHMGHVKMMAAAQPFLSGAISKTVNMPQDCTVDEIRDAYIQSWKMGVKAVAIYRDNSKRTQPLSTSSDAQKADKKESEVRKALRRKLPDERMSITHKFSIAGQEGYFMVGLYEDGSPGEIFIKMSKEGSTISGLMDSFAVAISMCLQYGVPLRVLVNKFSHTRFEPSGYTTNRDIPIAKSLMDYIFRWFDQKFHPNGDNGHFGKTAPATEGEAEPKKADRAPALTASAPSNPSLFTHEDGATSSGNLADAQASLMQSQADSPPCPNCGAITVRSGACYKCNECGTTTGCG